MRCYKKYISFLFNILTSGFVLLPYCLAAQDNIAIYRVGTNKLLMVNTNPYSLTVEIRGLQTCVVPALGSQTIHFPLYNKSAERIPFFVRYDSASFATDSMLCVYGSMIIDTKKENQAEVLNMISLLFAGQLKFEHFLDQIKRMSPVIAVDAADMLQLTDNLGKIYNSGQRNPEKSRQMTSVLKNCFDRTGALAFTNQGCLENSKTRLQAVKPFIFYATAFLNRQERASIEATIFAIAGFRVREFKQTGSHSTIIPAGYGQQPSYGISISYKYNAYDVYKIRNTGIQNYIPVTYLQSRAVYKKTTDSVFQKDQIYQWHLLSIGFGQELNSRDGSNGMGKSSLFFDFGLVSGILTSGKRDSGSGNISMLHAVSSFKDFVPYINLGFKYRVAKWLDIYIAYYSTFFYTNFVYGKPDIPSFRQFNLGLNFTLNRKISYQY